MELCKSHIVTGQQFMEVVLHTVQLRIGNENFAVNWTSHHQFRVRLPTRILTDRIVTTQISQISLGVVHYSLTLSLALAVVT